MADKKTQIEKFREAARAHEADESEDAFNASLKAIATNKNVGPAMERLAEELGQTDPKWTKGGKRKASLE